MLVHQVFPVVVQALDEGRLGAVLEERGRSEYVSYYNYYSLKFRYPAQTLYFTSS